MAVNVACPHCKQKLRVPDDWLAQTVECPDCEKSFVAAKDPEAEAAPPPMPGGAVPPPTPEEEEEEFAAPIEGGEDPDAAKRKKAKRRAKRLGGGTLVSALAKKQKSLEYPHRGVHVLTLGLMSLFFSIVCGATFFLAIGTAACGYYAYQMGMHDLGEMYTGRMDRSGRGMTIAGIITGCIGGGISALFIIGGFCFIILALIRALTGPVGQF